MIQIQVANIDQVISDYTKRIHQSIIKNKLSATEKKKIKNKNFSDGTTLQKKVNELHICKPNELLQKHVDFKTYLNTNFTDRQQKNIFKKYFDYDTILDYKSAKISHAYWLMNQLNVRVCPYCNRSYTYTVTKGKSGCRAQFDHFHCQDEYPYLSLSFYNLIPSCPTCNQKKSTTPIDINPYIEGFANNCVFRIDKIEKCVLDSNNFSDWGVRFVQENTKYDTNINTFLLNEFYNEHKDYISEIVFKARSYNEGYYQTLIDTFTGQGLSKKEMELIIFGNYLETQELGTRPLSKLSKDIIEQVELE